MSVRTPGRALVIGHSGDATGATIALLRIMRWCVNHGTLEPTFIFRSDGTLTDEFRKLGRTYVYSQLAEDRLDRVSSHFPGGASAARAGRLARAEWLRLLCRKERADLIYINTAILGGMVPVLEPLGIPFVTHVHELEHTLRHTDNLNGLETLIAHSQLLLAASRPVEEMLVRHGAEPARIVEIQEPVDERPSLTVGERRRLRHDVFDADDDTIVVAGCGVPGPRKGTDIFLRVAQAVLAASGIHGKVVFRWIGAQANHALYPFVEDVAQLGLDGVVSAIGWVSGAEQLLGAADVFLSTSREDPNPLAVLEAAAAERPIVCFHDAGGAEDLAQIGGALAVPFLDAEAMAAVVTRLICSPEERTRLGEAARTAVLRRNLTSVVGAQVLDALRQISGYAGVDAKAARPRSVSQ